MAKRITSLTALTNPKPNMEVIVYDVDDTYDKKMSYTNLMKPLTGSAAPAVTPDFIGQRFIDTTGDREYYAVGTGSAADWRKVARYEYGTVTVTSGGGDVTVNLDFDWSDGVLTIARSFAAADYWSDATPTTPKIDTTYDALTNGSYTDDQLLTHDASAAGNHHYAQIKTVNSTGVPKAATSNSFTLDDDTTNTGYIKWWITA